MPRISFLDELDSADFDALAKRSAEATDADIARILDGGAVSAEDFAALLSPSAERRIEDIAQLSAAMTREYFGNTMRLFAPLYLSNQCVNNCLYCGFAARNKIARRTLSHAEIEREVGAVKELGFRSILLVASENPRLVSPEYVGGAVEIAARQMAQVSAEIAPACVDDYALYVSRGCSGLTVFQETYNRRLYGALHPPGPKADFQWRLAAPERAAEAGFRNIGIGALLGLGDWRKEMFAVAMHARFLMRRFWKSAVSISLPRMRPAAGGYVCLPQNLPSDRQLALLICALRIYLGRVGIVVSTRESAGFRDGVMRLGVTAMSAFSSTNPGGYAERSDSGAQFDIDDSRTPAQFARALRAAGLDPVWKDFDAAFTPQK